MAYIAHSIRDLIVARADTSALAAINRALQKFLLLDITVAQFADVFAQTLVYGLFVARFIQSDIVTFSRQNAISIISETSPLLRMLFDNIADVDRDNEPLIKEVDDLLQLLAEIDIQAMMTGFGEIPRATASHGTCKSKLYHIRRAGESDFYEMFLAHYDPELREARGVYSTPQPVVSYIVRSIDVLLRSRFGCQNGLADTSTIPYMRTDERGEALLEPRPHVVLLDPACGTGAFLHGVIDHVRETYRRTGNSATWAEYVREHLLPRLFGVELLMAPYVIARLNLEMQLAGLDLSDSERSRWANDFQSAPIHTANAAAPHSSYAAHQRTTSYASRQVGCKENPLRGQAVCKESDKRLGIYLTNTLEELFQRGKEIFGHAIFDGINETEQVKGDHPVLVVLGNPPYAGHSANKGKWISRLIETYKEGCPELKKPAQAKWLSDDYVKFMRFAQWHIEGMGHGILAFVTNHSYLDNPTFRGMRRSLMQSFDEIYILDLHGNSKKKERAPDGSKDENVFDIQQGVAIGIFVKWQKKLTPANDLVPTRGTTTMDAERQDHSQAPNARLAEVHHADLWGLREEYELDAQGQPILTGSKYAWLRQHDISNTRWRTLNPQAPLYLFAPQDTQYLAEYQAGWKVPDIFRPNGDPAPGIVTTQDEFAISWSRDEAISKVERLLATDSEDEARQLFRLCTQDQWQYACAKKELADGRWRQDTVEILYRPFDKRWTVHNRHVAVHRRERVMRHMLSGKNLGITIGRAGQVINAAEWDIVFCTRDITEYNLYRRGGNNLFPLYLYSDVFRRGRFIAPIPPTADLSAPGSRQVNLAPEFIAEFATRLGIRWESGSWDTWDAWDSWDTSNLDGRGDGLEIFGPEDVLAYMYAVFYSPGYRERYAAFLKVDFPRLPLTSNVDLFRALCKLGHKLISLHLMEEPVPLITRYPVPGDNKIEMVRFIEPICRSDTCDPPTPGQVWINGTQYFEGVPPTAWAFHIGGYQVCQKWLKDRKGRRLSGDEVMHYQRIVAVLAETSQVMKKIDETIEGHGGWPISF